MPTAPDPAAEVAVTVVRTGGFAGVRREWRAVAAADEAAPWRELIAHCPWDHADQAGATDAAAGADRFCWSLAAVCGPQSYRADLAEQDVQGPWRALIDAVRAAPRHPPSPSPPRDR